MYTYDSSKRRQLSRSSWHAILRLLPEFCPFFLTHAVLTAIVSRLSMVRRHAALSVGPRGDRIVDACHRTHYHGHHTNAHAFSGSFALTPPPCFSTHPNCQSQTQITTQPAPTKTGHQSTRENTTGRYCPPCLWRGKPEKLGVTAVPAVMPRSARGSSHRATISCAGLVPVARGKKRRKAAPCVTSEFSTITPCSCERQQSPLADRLYRCWRIVGGGVSKVLCSVNVWESNAPRTANCVCLFRFLPIFFLPSVFRRW